MDGLREIIVRYWWEIYLIGLVITALFTRLIGDWRDDPEFRIFVSMIWPLWIVAAVIFAPIFIIGGIVGFVSGGFTEGTSNDTDIHNNIPYGVRAMIDEHNHQVVFGEVVTAAMMNDQFRTFTDPPIVKTKPKCAYCGRPINDCGCGARMAE